MQNALDRSREYMAAAHQSLENNLGPLARPVFEFADPFTPAIDAVEAASNGEYGGATLAAASILLKPLKSARTATDRLKGELFVRAGQAKSQTALDAARRELAGEVTGFDHVTKARNAQQGLLNRIEAVKRELGYPSLSPAQRGVLEQELGEASRLLDYTRRYVPR